MQIGDQMRSMPIVGAFGELATSAPGLVLDSYGMLAIALDRYSAATELGIGVTDQIVLHLGDEPNGLTTPVQLRIQR